MHGSIVLHHVSSFRSLVIFFGLVTSLLLPALERAASTETSASCPSAFAYPKAFRNGSVVTDYFGRKIGDPYRWLENSDSRITKNFIEAENNVTHEYLHSYDHYAAMKKMVTKLQDYPRYGQLEITGDWLKYVYNSGLQGQSVLLRQNLLDGSKEEAVFDPNQQSEDASTSIASSTWSWNGKFIGLMLSDGGSDWSTIRVLDVESKQLLHDSLKRVKFSCFTWTLDDKGFFYNSYPESSELNATATDTNVDQKLYYHRLGSPQSEDILCAEFPDNPTWKGEAEITESDGQYAVLIVRRSLERNNALWICDLHKLGNGITATYTFVRPLPWIKIVNDFDAEYGYFGNQGSIFYITTNLDAPNRKVIVIDVDRPEKHNWKTLIPEDPHHALQKALIVFHDRLILRYIEDVKSTMYLHCLTDGKRLHTFGVGMNTVTAVTAKEMQPYVIYKLESFINPGTLYKVDLSNSTKATVLHESASSAFGVNEYETKQVFYRSEKDVKIPMFITHRKGLEIGPETPCLLSGYGGFHASIMPSFDIKFISFIKAFDGILAVANIRGGSEYGETWWKQGALANKQNCFTDFQNAAIYLQISNYTSSEKLVILGTSNGGLLVGACSNQRPDLFGAAIPIVGVMDVLRFNKFTIGQSWTSDYGNPENKTDYDVLIKYSPLHNIHRQKHQYPATLVLTSEHDNRVPPLHSLKYVAELQHTLCDCEDEGPVNQTNPLMLRVEINAGHGAGKSTTNIIDETTDMLAFCAKALDYDWKGANS